MGGPWVEGHELGPQAVSRRSQKELRAWRQGPWSPAQGHTEWARLLRSPERAWGLSHGASPTLWSGWCYLDVNSQDTFEGKGGRNCPSCLIGERGSPPTPCRQWRILVPAVLQELRGPQGGGSLGGYRNHPYLRGSHITGAAGGEGWGGAGGFLGSAQGSEESSISLHPPRLILC